MLVPKRRAVSTEWVVGVEDVAWRVTGYGVRFAAQARTGTILRALITTDRKRLCRSCVECIVHSDSDRNVRMTSPSLRLSLRVYEAFPVNNEVNLALELLSASRAG